MRLDARKGDICWYVFDLKRCCPVRYVVWCDDATAQWGRCIKPFRRLGGELLTETIQEDRITIYPHKGLVFFNEPEQLQEEEPLARAQQGAHHD